MTDEFEIAEELDQVVGRMNTLEKIWDDSVDDFELLVERIEAIEKHLGIVPASPGPSLPENPELPQLADE